MESRVLNRRQDVQYSREKETGVAHGYRSRNRRVVDRFLVLGDGVVVAQAE